MAGIVVRDKEGDRDLYIAYDESGIAIRDNKGSRVERIAWADLYQMLQSRHKEVDHD